MTLGPTRGVHDIDNQASPQISKWWVAHKAACWWQEDSYSSVLCVSYWGFKHTEFTLEKEAQLSASLLKGFFEVSGR